ncbi:hypothetical protein [Salipaludibacillus daqingensis]|uniref:hypothetical protein n=1 Tax=Salipaludibacillus daqingensis TaxID=3041001 RepID=UPI0024746736|nr:hypothetical protein [Salipaludibacillus daqingensis]
MKKSFIFLFIFLLLNLGGCDTGQKTFEAQSADDASEISQKVAEDAEKTVKELDRVDDATAVSNKKDVYVHLDVRGFDRFFLKDIRKEAKDKLEAENPDGTVEVSTDKKIELELTELKQKLSDQEITRKQLEDDLKKVDKDLKAGV